MSRTLTLDEIETLAKDALRGAGAGDQQAASVAASTRAAERDGIRSHGLMYVPIYAEHVQCGKVDGTAIPQLEYSAPSAARIDAKSGFAHPAIDLGLPRLCEMARQNGIAIMNVTNSYNCGVLGYHAERIAEAGLLALCFTNAPASIAPIGGTRPVIGTNPFALGVPDGLGNAKFVVDQSASAIAKSEIVLRSKSGEPIEEGWALDSAGKPTIDAAEALKGSMLPSGGYKGFGIGIMAEIFAACLSGAVLGKDASPFSGTSGGPCNTGQCFIAIAPDAQSGELFSIQVDALCEAILSQPGTRLPGSKRTANRARIENEGTPVDDALIDRIKTFIG